MATESVADRIDPLMHAAAPPVQEPPSPPSRPASPRKRAPTVRPSVEDQPIAAIEVLEPVVAELPTAEVQVFDDLLVFDDLVVDKPVVEKPVVAERVSADLDFFDDLDFEKRVDGPVEAPEPYVLPKIIPGEPDPATDELAPAVAAEPKLAKFARAFKPDAERLRKKLARSLQPVVLPRHRPRVRRVTRVVRHIDTWSVFKIAVLFNIFLYAVCLTAGVMLWRVALNTGTIENIERFFESFGWQTFELKGGEIYHNAWIAGLFAVVGLTGLAVLAATMFNLITDLVGGVRVTVLEEEVTAREQHVVKWPRLMRPATPPHRVVQGKVVRGEAQGRPPID